MDGDARVPGLVGEVLDRPPADRWAGRRWRHAARRDRRPGCARSWRPGDGPPSSQRVGVALLFEAALQRAHRFAQLRCPARTFAFPERQLGRLARRRRHRHPIGADVLDAPGAGPQLKHVADAALVDELLVQLAQLGPAFAQLHRIHALVGDGAARGDRQPKRARAGRAPRRRCDPRRCAAAARRIPRPDSGRPASPGPRPARRASGCDRDGRGVTVSNSLSTGHSSAAAMATICCANTSRQRSGTRVGSTCSVEHGAHHRGTIRPDRRATWAGSRRARAHPPGGRCGPRAGGRGRPRPAIPPAPPDRWCPCRCPAPATRYTPAPESGRP